MHDVMNGKFAMYVVVYWCIHIDIYLVNMQIEHYILAAVFTLLHVVLEVVTFL